MIKHNVDVPLHPVSVGCTGCVIADRRGLRNMVKIIVAPGNGGCGQNTLQANWYGWFHGEMLKTRARLCVPKLA